MPRRVPKRLMPHKNLISYRPKTGESAYGPIFGAEVVCRRGAIHDKRKLVTDRDGKQVWAESRIALDPEHLMPEGSEVTIWRGRPNERTITAIVVSYADFDGLPRFVEIALT